MKYHALLEYLRPTFKTELEELALIEIETATENNPVRAVTILQKHFKNTGEQLNIRRIQEVVQELRMLGLPICANGRGYFWPSHEFDLDNYIDSITRRIKELSTMRANVKKGRGRIYITTEATIEAE